ncbi:DNA repair protein RAD16 [Coemansia sp. Cherry 401B]|nr:DNA repair protein RAD16 [Coemansia sp. Cherry 401B]
MTLDPLLPFQRQVLDDLLDEDALCIVARGLGLNRILAELARICATPRALVFLLHASEHDEDDLQHYFMQMRSGEATDAATTMQVVKNETNAGQRAQLYRQGGVISVTSRILIVDLLNDVVPTELVTGVVVHNASQVTAESIEAFVLRVIRQRNAQAFVKALSDAPEAFVQGFAPVEKILKVLGLRHVHLWPRFHVAVQRDLAREVPVVELRQPQTRAMEEVQQAVLDCLAATIAELGAATKLLDTETFNVESSLFRFFDVMVKRRLGPYWHRLGPRARGMVNDLASLRRVGELVTAYDAVALLEYLDTLLLAARPGAGPAVSWMATDSANILYATARARTFVRMADPLPAHTQGQLRAQGLPDNIEPVLEVPPKLEALSQILDEIGVLNRTDNAGPVLVMAGSARECRMIRDYLRLLHKRVKIGERQHPQMMVDRLRMFFRRKAQVSGIRGASQTQPTTQPGVQRRAPPAKRRRVRGASATGTRVPRAPADALEQESTDLATAVAPTTEDAENIYEEDEDEALGAFDEHFGLLAGHETVVVHAYSGGRGILEALRPSFVVLYDPDAAFVREVEMYGTRACVRQVYFVVYDNSLEEQRYLSAIRREREAFERLIGDKAGLVVPLDSSNAVSPAGRLLQTIVGRSQRSGRMEPTEAAVVVDVREFRAPLASLLHASGISVIPRTLAVGDYVLHDGLAIERKSLPDLIGSLRSGRLFNQAAAMTRHYPCAALLVEFEVNSSFSLQAIGGLPDSVSPTTLTSQLAILAMAFPRLRVLWSCSPYETVSIFAELKRGLPEPDAAKAVAVGQDEDLDTESLYVQAPINLLQTLPGVTQANYQKLARRFDNVRALCAAERAELDELLGSDAAKKLHEFLHRSK